MFRHFSLSLVVGLWLFSGLVFGQEYYNEIFDANGKVRPQYAEMYAEFQKLPAQFQKNFVKMSRVDFQGDNALYAVPRLFTQDEADFNVRATQQRGKALLMFLEDHYSGRKTYLDTIIPKSVIERILKRNGDDVWEGLVKPENIAFPYGPDVIRDATGQWRVLEDNPGYIGGPGDLVRAREILQRRGGSYMSKLKPLDDPSQYYRDLSAEFRARSNPPNGKIVVLQTPPYPDNEDVRLRQLYNEQGIEVLTPFGKNKRLVVTNQGVFLEKRIAKRKYSRERVGFVVLNGEHTDFDLSHPNVAARNLKEWGLSSLHDADLTKAQRDAIAKALEPTPKTGHPDPVALKQALDAAGYGPSMAEERIHSIEGLNQAILDGKVATNYSHGVDFVGDKELTIYVESMIRHYLHEEPLYKNIPTDRFANYDAQGHIHFNESLSAKVLADPKKYVLKPVDGRGGDGVAVGAKISSSEMQSAIAQAHASPERYIAQDYTALSQLLTGIVDSRWISSVSRRGVLVSQTSWGRFLPKDGDGKVNLGAHGLELASVVVANPPTDRTHKASGNGCGKWLQNLAP